MAAVDAAIIMQLVDDDVAQVLEALRPLGVMRQDAAVQHVGIGQHDVGALADRLAGILRRVAVVGERPDVGIPSHRRRPGIREADPRRAPWSGNRYIARAPGSLRMRFSTGRL